MSPGRPSPIKPGGGARHLSLIHISRIVNDKVLVLAYPQGYATHMEQILSGNHKKVVQDYLERLINCRLDLAVEVDEPYQDSDSQGDGGNGDDLHPLVKAAITILDGKVVT